MRLTKLLLAMPVLVIPLMASECGKTTRTSSANIERALCEQADFYFIRLFPETYAKLTEIEKEDYRERLAAYRAENCPKILESHDEQ